jgi:hypothetical protein
MSPYDRKGVLMFSIVLAAALTTAPAHPLFIAPKVFHHLSRDPVMAATMEHGLVHFVAEYRTSARLRYGSVLVPRSIVILIGTTQSFGMDAAGFGAARRQLMARGRGVKVIGSKAVKICDGESGWLNEFTRSDSDETLDEMYAASGDKMYIARLTYPRASGSFGGRDALRTLCPPAQTIAHSSAVALPFVPPANWAAGNVATIELPSNLQAVGMWLHLAAHSPFMESITLIKAPALPENVDAEAQAQAQIDSIKANAEGFQLQGSRTQKLCNGAADGWALAYSQIKNGRRYAIEQTFGYGTDASYLLTYTRRYGDPADPAARKALGTLCPQSIKENAP